MEGRKITIFGVNVVFQPSPRMLKLVLIVLIVLSMAALGSLWWIRSSIVSDTEELRQEAVHLIDANDQLEDKIEDVGSVQGILDIAEEELNLVDPNTVVIQPTEG